ncbi:MAG TPA: CARDB domain-containing protein [Thermoanaerobaculia bacterium]|nr:CARDB domain-containing protein [Thermoanaerobaculia bacterium]
MTPPNAGPDTLCQLKVDVKNAGDRIASQLAFAVKINGQELPVYRNQLFMQRLDPGKTTTVKLYNFWTTESTRPAPADGKYKVEVTLQSAQWYQIATKDSTEEWTPQGAVSGLPVTATVTIAK